MFNKCSTQCENWWMDGWIDELAIYTDRCYTCTCMFNKCSTQCKNWWMDGWIDELAIYTDRWIDRCMNGQMDTQVKENIYRFVD